MIQNSGILADGAPRIGGMALAKSALSAIHSPVIYIQGGPTDISYANGMDDFQRIDHVAVMVNVNGVGHGETYFEPSGGKAAQVAVAWLEWQLRGDPRRRRASSRMPGLCGDSRGRDRAQEPALERLLVGRQQPRPGLLGRRLVQQTGLS